MGSIIDHYFICRLLFEIQSFMHVETVGRLHCCKYKFVLMLQVILVVLVLGSECVWQWYTVLSPHAKPQIIIKTVDFVRLIYSGPLCYIFSDSHNNICSLWLHYNLQSTMLCDHHHHHHHHLHIVIKVLKMTSRLSGTHTPAAFIKTFNIVLPAL